MKKMWRWVGYRISDNSGSGWNEVRFAFAPAWMKQESDLREYIIGERETWALHAERYSFALVKHARPSRKRIKEELDSASDAYLSLSTKLTDLGSRL